MPFIPVQSTGHYGNLCKLDPQFFVRWVAQQVLIHYDSLIEMNPQPLRIFYQTPNKDWLFVGGFDP